MKGLFLIACLISSVYCAPYISGDNYKTHQNVNFGNVEATATRNTNTASINQNKVGDSAQNMVKNLNVGRGNINGDSYTAERSVAGNNIKANVNANNGAVHVSQSTIGNRNQNLLVNKYGNRENQYGDDHKTVEVVKITNVNTNVGHNWGSQNIRQANAGNNEHNEFKNVAASDESSPYSTYWSSSS